MAHKIRVQKEQNKNQLKWDFLIGGYFLLMIGSWLFGLGWFGQYRVIGIAISGLLLAIIGLLIMFYSIWNYMKLPDND